MGIFILEENMKRITRFLSCVLLGTLLFGCKNPDNTASNGRDMKIALYGADSSKTWNVWAWKELGSSDENYDTLSWPGGTFQLTQTDEYGCKYTTMSIDRDVELGLLFIGSDGTNQTNDIYVPTSVLQNNNELYFIYGSTDYYTDFNKVYGIQAASITDVACNTVVATVVYSTAPTKDDFVIKNSDDETLTINSVSCSGVNITITLSNGNLSKIPYTVTYNDKSVTTILAPDVEAEIIDSNYVYSSNDLGLTLNGYEATFKSWAPTASSVLLLLYSDASNLITASDTKDMTNTNGVWSTTVTDISSYKYYKYKITVNGISYEVADIWSFAASPDSVASQIVNINDGTSAVNESATETYDGTTSSYVNPFTGSYSDAVIYEMHIRDWSKAFGSTNTGKFEEITDALNDPEGFAAHLNDLGVTHVQILPMFDYAEKNSDTEYNWGYNPYHYNVPEGRYVKDMVDGTDAVKQMRSMIEAFHNAGISVNMDVVYNHTNGTGTDSLYDMTVPKYFYRLQKDGTYSNGSGCGNEIATNHVMVKKYVIDSLKHWMLDYHINGFRFDLMGCLEADTMKEIYDTLYEIDNHVMVYGEPWTGGTSAVVDGAVCAGDGTTGLGYGAFDDDFRDAIKGAEFGGFGKGQVQGTFNDKNINLGLTGSQITSNNRNSTGKPGLAIHYAECHDNYTLFDKLAISILGKTSYSGDLFKALKVSQKNNVYAQDKLAAAFIFLSQGTPFINGGQEFLRTKQGDENSYKSSDTINAIDLSFKTTYSDVYNTYKGLIALRKTNSDAFGSNTSATAEVYNSTAGVTKYETGDFCVYFNATSAAVDISTTGYTTFVDVTTGTPTESTTLPASVAAKSFVILKK